MATVNGTPGKDFIHRAGDGRIAPAGYNDITGVTTGDDTINGLAGDDIIFGDSGDDVLEWRARRRRTGRRGGHRLGRL